MKTSSEKEKKLGTALGKLVNLNLNTNLKETVFNPFNKGRFQKHAEGGVPFFACPLSCHPFIQ